MDSGPSCLGIRAIRVLFSRGEIFFYLENPFNFHYHKLPHHHPKPLEEPNMEPVRPRSFEGFHRVKGKQDLNIRRRHGEVESLRIQENVTKGEGGVQDPITQDLIRRVESIEARKENLFNSIYQPNSHKDL